MATLEQKIIDELKLALEYQEPTGDYAQQNTRGRFYCALFVTQGDGSIVHFAG